MANTVSDFEEVQDIIHLLSQRRTYGDNGITDRYADWYNIPCDTASVNDMRKVYGLTTGRLMIGLASVTVENEQDAINLKLALG